MSESDESWEDFSIDEEDVYSTTTADSDSEHGSSPEERELREGSDDEAEGEDRRGAEPYRFEPLAIADIAPEEPGDNNNQDRLLNTAW